MEGNNEKGSTKIQNGSFIRWQSRSIEELGKAVNLLLTLCLATIGFVLAKLLDKDFKFQNCSSNTIVIIGVFILLISTILLLVLMYNRLQAFKKTTEIARKREKNERNDIDTLRLEVKKKDKCTWMLFHYSINTFIVGEAIIIIGFITEVAKRL